METHDRIPRNLMRVRVRELRPGEGTWVSSYNLHVCENGRVFVDVDQHIWPRAYDDWAKEPRKDEFFVQRTETGWRMHILGRDHISPRPSELSAEDREHHALINEVVIHPDEDEVCPCCQGAGIVNLAGRQSYGAYREVPFELMRRVWAQLEKLEALEKTP